MIPARAATLLCVLGAGATLFAQEWRFRTGVDAVRVDTLVVDGNRPVRGLTAADFELRDDGVVQQITDVSYETLPINVISVLDLSGSVQGSPLAQLKEGMLALFAAFNDGDRAALVTFSQRLTLHTTLTDDRATLRRLVNAVRPGGTTSVLDAVFAGLAMRESDPGRTLLLLFSDGIDTASWLTARDVLDSATRSDVVIYAVTLERSGAPFLGTVPSRRPQSGFHEGRKLLEALADKTGGRVFFADNERTLQKTLVDVLLEFKQRYVLSYTPRSVRAGGWHTIEVKLRGRRGQVTARRGYFAPPAGPATRTPK